MADIIGIYKSYLGRINTINYIVKQSIFGNNV